MQEAEREAQAMIERQAQQEAAAAARGGGAGAKGGAKARIRNGGSRIKDEARELGGASKLGATSRE